MQIGYSSFRDLLNNSESEYKVLFNNNDLFDKIYFPLGISEIFSGMFYMLLKETLHGIKIGSKSDSNEAEPYALWYALEKPGVINKYNIEIAFFSFNDLGTSVDDNINCYKIFHTELGDYFINDENIPQQGALLLRVSCGDRLPFFPFIANISKPHDTILQGLLYCGIVLENWNVFSPSKKDKVPTDIILELSYVKKKGNIFILGAGKAHLTRPDTLKNTENNTGLFSDRKINPIHFYYLPTFNRKLVKRLEDFGINIENDTQDLVWPDETEINDKKHEDNNIGTANKTVFSIFDVLGEYRSKENYSCVLFPHMIKICADSLGVKYGELEKIVEIHKLAHAITHVGRDLDGNIWSNFDKTSSEILENLAQSLTFTSDIVSNRSDFMNAFEKLNKNQPQIYKNFSELAKFTKEQFREYLLNLRNK